jgi:head-tail adaptor
MPGAGAYDRRLAWRRHLYAADPADGFGSPPDTLTAFGKVWAALDAESAGPESREGADANVRRATARVRGPREVKPLDTLTETVDGVVTVWEVETARPDPAAREWVCELVTPPTRPGA